MHEPIHVNFGHGWILRLIFTCTIGCAWPFFGAGAASFYSGVGANSLTARSALVIGVGDYESLRRLGPNPVNDANKVADFLKSMGFGRVIRSPDMPGATTSSIT